MASRSSKNMKELCLLAILGGCREAMEEHFLKLLQEQRLCGTQISFGWPQGPVNRKIFPEINGTWQILGSTRPWDNHSISQGSHAQGSFLSGAKAEVKA